MTLLAQDVVERLAEHRTLGKVPRAELEWLAAHGEIRRLEPGEVLSKKGEQVAALYVILSGRLGMFVDRGAGPQKLVEWREGDVSGMLPYSRLLTPPGDTSALEPLEVLAIRREDLQAMTRECFETTTVLVHLMVDRTRMFTSTQLQDEKLVSLGKLSAGLAHELNNPASAIERCAAMLEDRIADSEAATRRLYAATMSAAELAATDALLAGCMARRSGSERTSLEQMDREEAIADWLAAHGLEMTYSAMLADTEVTVESLDAFAAVMDSAANKVATNAVLHLAAADGAVRSLTGSIQECAMRISGLITAVKGFTHMDQANVAEVVDLGASLRNTVEVLKAKARTKSVTVSLELEPELPKVRGFAAELNQVWGNLIDNALDALAHGGRLEVAVIRENKNMVVVVRDDGPGIPEAIRDQIFDPFFTTKPLGQGTGLGLDIARRLVLHNDGQISFESQPGRTEFRVTVPLAESLPA